MRRTPNHAAQQPHTCPSVTLALHDGTERAYRLDDPGACPHSGTANTVRSAYEPRVHLAYLLACQGHDPGRLADFADLPLAAAHRITEAARGPRA
ncbi:hypothetical protein [Kitasatospora sp. CB01950]|uniref:hypothetical protein n=1 Tax=Kitasatospora sp. CB01950 TaxID=1703930 RepID=UPI00093A127E|nr:hypothetical protein [Kitasatospora sp. CB01950]OKJ16002.1 hypothetical protein AMK19_07415 [Kitasatospora sp. CB01950]